MYHYLNNKYCRDVDQNALKAFFQDIFEPCGDSTTQVEYDHGSESLYVCIYV